MLVARVLEQCGQCEGCVRGVGVRGVREGSGERSTCGEWVRGVREGSG